MENGRREVLVTIGILVLSFVSFVLIRKYLLNGGDKSITPTDDTKEQPTIANANSLPVPSD